MYYAIQKYAKSRSMRIYIKYCIANNTVCNNA